MDALGWLVPLRHAHLALVAASGSLFAVRAAARVAGARWPMRPGFRIGSVLIDTLLLAAGASLWALLSYHPLREPWLGTKLLLLVVYVVLGTFALKRARTAASRAAFALAALMVFVTIASIGWTRDALGLWRFLA